MNNIVKRGDLTRFRCLRCANCCSSGPNVALTAFDICRISRKLNAPWRSLIGVYLYAVIADAIPIPLLRGVDDKCVFLRKEGGVYACAIYDARPMRCRLFPFIPIAPKVTDRMEVSRICPGVSAGERAPPPWDILELYLSEWREHYKRLHHKIIDIGMEPLQALEAVIDEVCQELAQ